MSLVLCGTNSSNQQALSAHISLLQHRIAELEKGLIKDNQVVVESTKEKSCVLKQLKRIKNCEDKEQKVMAVCIV